MCDILYVLCIICNCIMYNTYCAERVLNVLCIIGYLYDKHIAYLVIILRTCI